MRTKAERAKGATLRPLAPRDLAQVVAIDTALSGRRRGAYFERRLAAARRRPELHAQLAVDEKGALAGYVLARLMQGEFGRAEPALRLEVIGVKGAAQGRGLGAVLARALEDEAGRRGAHELRTAAVWRDHALLGFLDAQGWSLGRNLVLECALADSPLGSPDEAPVAVPQAERGPADRNDYGAPAPNDFEALARDSAELRTLAAGDLDDIARIDRRLSGRDRRAYLAARLEEALEDAALRLSLLARLEGTAAGFLMASADYGDFGRAEPAAILDTVGVDPGFARRGVGHAMLSQLFLNLRALGIERIETVVGPANPDLFAFLAGAGFRPGERLAFVKRLP
jgi:predicted N-acetyltransferase YhbS